MARKPISKKDFKTVETRDANARVTKRSKPDPFRGYWWNADGDHLHTAVWSTVDIVREQQGRRRAANKRNEKLYGDSEVAPGPQSPEMDALEERITFNLVRMAVDTLCAKVSKQKPKTAFLTDGGEWAQQRRARRLDRYVEGTLKRLGCHPKSRDEFRDATIYDLGAEKWYLGPDGDQLRICVDRVHPESILVDAVDGQHGTPRCMYQSLAVPREVVKAQVFEWFECGEFGEGKEATAKLEKLLDAVDNAATPEDDDSLTKLVPDAVGDFVEVREAWHLPSRPVRDEKDSDATDGRHVLTISNATLLEEKWLREDFPFVFTLFSKRTRGFYGCGVAEQLTKWQRTINLKLRRANEAMKLMALGRTYLEEGSEVVEEHLTNDVGGVVKYRGTPPVVQTPPSGAAELLASVTQDINMGLESVGVSKLDATATKPTGLDSRAALREYNDIASERFVLVSQMLEESWVWRSRQVLALSREAEEKGMPLKALSEGRYGLEPISWKDVALDEEMLVLNALPTSALPGTPAARKQTVEEWYAAGWIDGITARRLMDMPDLDSANNVAFAGQEDIEWSIEDMMDGKPYQAPEPYQDLSYGVKRVQSAYLRAKRQGAPDAVLDDLRAWMEQAQSMLDSTQAPPPGAAPSMDAGPMAGMQPPPPGPAANPIAPPLA